MSEHIEGHCDLKRKVQAISNFYEEFKRLIIPILYSNAEGMLDVCILTPACYEVNCNITLTLKEMKDLLKDSQELQIILDKDITDIKNNLDTYPEILKDAFLELFGEKPIKKPIIEEAKVQDNNKEEEKRSPIELDKAKSNEIIPNEVNKGKGYLKEGETTLASN